MKKLLSFLLISCGLVFAQAPQRNQYANHVQGDAFTIPNVAGSQAVSFEYTFDVTPAAVSITIQGCMRGKDGQPGAVGTCDAAADTYAGTTNSIRSPSLTKVYDTFLITVTTLSAGTKLTVGTTVVVSKAGTSGGSGGGITNGAGANVIPKSDGVNLVASSLTDNATAVTGTEPIRLGDGLVGTPSYSFSGDTNTGFFRTSAGTIDMTGSGVSIIRLQSGVGVVLGASQPLVWNIGSRDTGLSKVSAGIVGVGNGSNGDISGILQASQTQVTRYGTLSNCSSSAAPAACGTATAGSVVVAAGATTVTVNTSSVTANSQIFLQPDDSLGTKLSVTCNTTAATLAAEAWVSARTAATSFVITVSAAPTVNPECFSYFIVN